MTQVIERIISGACVGADMGGLYAAEALGFPTGGWDWHHTDWLAERFGIRPAKEFKKMNVESHNRTMLNVLDSDCTIHCATSTEKVTNWPLHEWRKPYVEIRWDGYGKEDWPFEENMKKVREFMALMRYIQGAPLVINIAGDAKIHMESEVSEFLQVTWEPFVVRKETISV